MNTYFICYTTTMSTTFSQEYAKLNNEQKQAVDAIEGPVMVIAGPGTGKTQILTLRIANIIKETDTDPESILALTFTEAAVHNMRRRLASLMGPEAYRVNIFTFHGFCHSLIMGYPDAFPEIIGSEPIDTVEQNNIIEDILYNGKFFHIRPSAKPHHYVKTVLSRISSLKREGVAAQDFNDIINEAQKEFDNNDEKIHSKGAHKGKMKGAFVDIQKQIEKNKDLAIVYEAYNTQLRERGLFDYDDMIAQVVRALEHDEDFLRQLQEQYHYLLADEHQDANNPQNRLLELLANFHASPNIFVVGDEKQSIFRFQGASLENFFYFKHLYPTAQIVHLQENYRSTQTILDSAEHVLAGQAPLRSQNKENERMITFAEFEEERMEIFGISEHIKKEHESGTPLHEIAILYQHNKDAFPIAEILQKQNIPYVIESDQDLFADERINKLIAMVRACAEPLRDDLMATLLHIDVFGLDPLDVFTLIRATRKQRGDQNQVHIFELLKKPALRKDLDLINEDAVDALATLITEWVTMSHNERLLAVIENIMRSSGLLASIVDSEDMVSGLDALDRFFAEVRVVDQKKRHATLVDMVSYVDTIQERGIFIKKKKHSPVRDAVRLMTAHRSKGLEFDYVHLVHAVDGKWSNKRSKNELPLLEKVFELIDNPEKRAYVEDMLHIQDDERRVFYVALTRAKKGVMISCARHNADGKEQSPASFIAEIDEKLIEKLDTEPYETMYHQYKGTLYMTPAKHVDRPFSKEFIRELFMRQGLSVSALNNYLKSPWLYFYRNLMRIPQTMTSSLVYGNLIHGALADFFDAYTQDKNLSKDDLLAYFDAHIERAHIDDVEYETLKEKGYTALSTWYDAYHATWGQNSLQEYSITDVSLRDDIRLTGNIDRIEIRDDGSVSVIDYKTGKAKSRNALMGKTKSDEGDYYRQLLFYGLLLKYHKNGTYRVTEGIIDFVEPDDKGKLRRERFDIPAEEVQELEELVIRVSDEIMNLDFWDEPCDPEICDYCDLVDALKRNPRP